MTGVTQNLALTVVAVVAAAAVAVVARAISRRRAAVPARCDVREPLLPLEKRLTAILPGVSTVTFFRTEPGADATAAEAYFRARVHVIVTANPWLTAYIGVHRGQLSLCYSSAGKPEVSYFTTAADDKLSEDLSYQELQNRLEPYLVRKVRVGDSSDQLFRVTLLTGHGGAKALVVSLSHILGDGSTFYNIYKQLQPTAKVETLVAKRDARFAEKRDAYTSMLDDAGRAYLSSPLPFLGTVTRGLLKKGMNALGLSHLLPRPEGFFFLVNQSFLEEEKARLKDGDKWVSSNDIITSWYMDNVCKAEPGSKMMAVNLRGRDPSLSHDLAGNYLGLTIYAPGDDVSPKGVRRSLALASRCPRSGAFPGLVGSVQSPWTIVTNWAPFYTHLSVSGLVSCKHIPLLPDNESLGLANTCIIFNPGFLEQPDAIAVFAAKGYFTGRLALEARKSELVGQQFLAMLACERRRSCCGAKAGGQLVHQHAEQRAVKAA